MPIEGRAATTKVRFLDAKHHPIAGLRVRVVPDGDRLPGDVPLTSPERELETDAKGVVEFAPDAVAAVIERFQHGAMDAEIDEDADQDDEGDGDPEFRFGEHRC